MHIITIPKNKNAKQLFIRARRSASCPWQVYAAAARMEWRLGREADVARRIFEKGLDAGAGAGASQGQGAAGCLAEPAFVLAYADFLCGALGGDSGPLLPLRRSLCVFCFRESRPPSSCLAPACPFTLQSPSNT